MNPSRIFHFFKRESTDLNSGQLVSVANTKNQMSQLVAIEASAV
jgi:hypothetical protein